MHTLSNFRRVPYLYTASRQLRSIRFTECSYPRANFCKSSELDMNKHWCEDSSHIYRGRLRTIDSSLARAKCNEKPQNFSAISERYGLRLMHWEEQDGARVIQMAWKTGICRGPFIKKKSSPILWSYGFWRVEILSIKIHLDD